MNSFIQKCRKTRDEMKLVASENVQKLKCITRIKKKSNEPITQLEQNSTEQSCELLDDSNTAEASTSCHTETISKQPVSRPTALDLKMLQAKTPFYYEPKSKEDRSSSSSGSEVTETTSISGSLSD